jgi:hypothetical protein
MTVRSYSRGHEIIFKNNEWVYADTLKSIKKERPCKKCGERPTKEGFDACIGNLGKDIISACCGHGVEKSYVLRKT